MNVSGVIFFLSRAKETKKQKKKMPDLRLDNREFKIRRLRTTTTDKHATAHDQNHVTVRFSRVVGQHSLTSVERPLNLRSDFVNFYAL